MPQPASIPLFGSTSGEQWLRQQKTLNLQPRIFSHIKIEAFGTTAEPC
jgi:hypothetical protein